MENSLWKWIFWILLSCGVAKAELPPEAYEGMKKRAGEVLMIEVIDVKHQLWVFRKKEWVRAKVTKVLRSKKGVKAGDVIDIEYRYQPLGNAVGPSPIPQLNKGLKLKAWLSWSEEQGSYRAAARGDTFEWIE